MRVAIRFHDIFPRWTCQGSFSPKENSRRNLRSFRAFPMYKSMEEPAPKSSSKVVNFGLYKIKKTLREEGFEVLEKPNGNISLVIRVGKEREKS
ncbi:hypothetical protein BWD12_05375 [Leptospira santarosai serovar Bananal]|nr:hypothetical protein BWD12_05375 [Leptospira santarosai serovar Bananal]